LSVNSEFVNMSVLGILFPSENNAMCRDASKTVLLMSLCV